MVNFQDRSIRSVSISMSFSINLLMALPSTASANGCEGGAGLSASVEIENQQECAVEDKKTFKAYRVTDELVEEESRNNFTKGDRVILCVELPFQGYVAIWDAAPNGQIERLYPNSISHPNNQRAVKLNNEQKHCVGEIGSGYEITVTPEEGTGGGQFYLLVTDREDMQLNEDDFYVPAYGLSMSIQSEGTKVEDINGYYDTWLQYTVTE